MADLDGNYADPSESGPNQLNGQTSRQPRRNPDYVNLSDKATLCNKPTYENSDPLQSEISGQGRKNVTRK